jgi:hypothetical protein
VSAASSALSGSRHHMIGLESVISILFCGSGEEPVAESEDAMA